MGGNALKEVPTRRLNAADFHAVAAAVVQALQDRFGARAQVIPSYGAKADFGDLDVIVEQEKVLVPGDGHAALEAFAQEFGHARSFKPNGNVLSFDFRHSPEEDEGFQVDLILTPADEFDLAVNYFSFNDLGNLVGRTAHKMGFTYGHRGLLYPMRDGTHLFKTIDVCQDTDQALEFLGYDPARFRQGFETMEEIFHYVTSSKYFNREIFLLENRNHAARVRDRKRKTYMMFLKHLEDRPDLPAFEYPEEKSKWLPLAFQAFPKLQGQLESAHQELAESRFVRSVFSGEKVSAWTGVQGKELGKLMSRVREAFATREEWVDFLRSKGEDGLREVVDQQLAALNEKRSGPKL